MSRGGARPNSGGARVGAGRPKGSKSAAKNKSAKVADVAPKPTKTAAERAHHSTALAFAIAVINDPEAAMNDKIRLAVAAMPFMHAKLESVGQGKKDAKADAAKGAASGRFAPSAPPKLVVSNS